MPSYSKREGAVAIAYQADPATAAADPVFTVVCDDCTLPGEPVQYERTNNTTAESLGMEDGGKDCTFSIDGIEPNAELMGYLLWLFGGGYSRATTIHTITQEFDSQYFTVFKDHGALFDAVNQVQTAIGCRADNLVIDQQAKAFAKVSMSGLACDNGVDVTPLAPAVSLVADDAPLSWKAIQNGAFKLGYNTLTTTADDNITGVKLTLGRALTYAGVKLGSNQPDSLIQGAREVMVEYTRDFAGDTAGQAEYAQWLTGISYISLNMKWLMGTNYVDVTIPHIRMTADPLPGVGSGEEAQIVTVSGKAYMNASSEIMDITTVDGNSTVDFDSL